MSDIIIPHIKYEIVAPCKFWRAVDVGVHMTDQHGNDLASQHIDGFKTFDIPTPVSPTDPANCRLMITNHRMSFRAVERPRAVQVFDFPEWEESLQ